MPEVVGGYQPNEDEIKLAEEHMTADETDASARRELGLKYLGDNYKKLADAGATELAEKVASDLKHYENKPTDSLRLKDIYVNEEDKIGAVLLDSDSSLVGSSGGPCRSKQIQVQAGGGVASLYLFGVKHDYFPKEDIPELQYSKIKEVTYDDEKDKIKASFDGDKSVWMLEPGHHYFVSQDSRAKKLVAKETEYALIYSINGGEQQSVVMLGDELAKFKSEMKDKYGESFVSKIDSTYERSYPAEKIRKH